MRSNAGVAVAALTDAGFMEMPLLRVVGLSISRTTTFPALPSSAASRAGTCESRKRRGGGRLGGARGGGDGRGGCSRRGMGGGGRSVRRRWRRAGARGGRPARRARGRGDGAVRELQDAAGAGAAARR